jgi:hypothetical protein
MIFRRSATKEVSFSQSMWKLCALKECTSDERYFVLRLLAGKCRRACLFTPKKFMCLPQFKVTRHDVPLDTQPTYMALNPSEPRNWNDIIKWDHTARRSPNTSSSRVASPRYGFLGPYGTPFIGPSGRRTPFIGPSGRRQRSTFFLSF